MAWFLADPGFVADSEVVATRVGYPRVDEMGLSTQDDSCQGGAMMREAKFGIGEVVEHRYRPFRGVIFDVDPLFSHTEEWWLSIPEDIRPHKNQPYYHVFAETEDSTYVAYVSEQNLVSDETQTPCRHPQLELIFDRFEDGSYVLKDRVQN